ncbi:MAG: GNAT family N-acetyltransferase [Tabrizicola sp.]|nr:GNAT family N-acetyltransferase [Tabrizicola sp.]
MTWNLPPTGPAAQQMATTVATVPVITTERLRLRAPNLSDWHAYREVLLSDRAAFMGGPFTEEDAFADFCQGVAGWMLRGAGMWTITLAGDETALGWLFLWQEMGDPEPEMGWILVKEAEGKGYALEAAKAVLPMAVALFGKGGFVSYIDDGNDASARLALRLGAVRDPKAEARLDEPGLQVYRHVLGGLDAGADVPRFGKTAGSQIEDAKKTSETGE